MRGFRPIVASLVLPLLFLGGCAATHDIKARRQAAYGAYNAGDYDAAAGRFAELVEEIPRDAELWFRLGNAYVKTKRPRQAVEAYENALLRDPQLAKAWYNKGIVHMQEALKAFVDMQKHVDENTEVGRQGNRMRDGVFELLEGTEDESGNADE